MDDDEINAMANRLRTNGWADKPEPYFEASRVTVTTSSRKPLPVDPAVAEAARWLDQNWATMRGRPVRSVIADRFGMTFDQAQRVVTEAERRRGGHG